MSKRLMCPLIVGMMVMVSVLYIFSPASERKPGIRHISEEMALDGSGVTSSLLPAQAVEDPSADQKGNRTSCADINPQAGVIVAHDELDSTWYELQQIGNIGRMIIVGPDGHRGFSWMSSDGIFPPPPRYVYSKGRNVDGTYHGPTPVDLAGGTAPGFVNQSHTYDGLPVLVYHRLHVDPMGDPTPFCMLARSGFPDFPNFNHRWDLPDYIINTASDEKGKWPRVAVKYDQGEGKDFVHVVVTEGNTYDGYSRMMAYQRCYWAEWTRLECQNYFNGSTQTYLTEPNQYYYAEERPLAHFNYTCSTEPVVEVSPVSERLAIAFIKPACGGVEDWCGYLGDVAYVESMVNGEDWVDGTNYPPADDNITNYGCGYPEDERAWYDLNACYDYNDSLHVIWSTVGFPDLGYFDPSVSKLYHWSKETGTQMITSAVWGGTDPGYRSANIAKMSISAVDPTFHPPDSNFIYCIWVQFDSSDTSAGGYGNGDIYGAGSRDGGATWGPCYNLTNTKTPGCAAGDCLSEHWASLSQNMRDGNLHIQYVCDKDAGAAVVDEGEWTENPVMYLELEAWDPGTSFLRGDSNGDGIINVGDVVYLVSYLYRGGPAPGPLWVGDCNCDDIINVGDIVSLVSYLYRGGPPPGC